METFKEYLDKQNPEKLAKFLVESMEYELSEAEEAIIDDAVAIFLAEGKTIEDLDSEFTNEGIFGSILGGLTGAALGKTIGETIAKVLGIQKGVLYDLLTSRLVGAALGAQLGSRF
jgi:uncharacterized membrane protein YeaQ/YmgE (transglycosylase-associated protein family)